MRMRTVIAFIIAFAITFGVSAFWSAASDERAGDTDANIVSDAGSKTGEADGQPKKGNAVGRVFKAPFKAIGRLFGIGRDKDRVQRMTEADARKFESSPAIRVVDARTEKPTDDRGGLTPRQRLVRGRMLIGLGRTNEAIEDLSAAASSDPQMAEAYSLLGVAFDRKGMPERAREEFERALKIEPDDAQTLNNLGFLLYKMGNYRVAVDRLKKALKLAPSDDRILNNLALAQCRLGKYDDAFKNFARAGGEFTGHVNTATILERQGNVNEAIRHYEAAARLKPESAVALRRLERLYTTTGQAAEAERVRRLLANPPATNAAAGQERN